MSGLQNVDSRPLGKNMYGNGDAMAGLRKTTVLTEHDIDGIIADIKKRYGITHCQRSYITADDELEFVHYTISFKVQKEKKTVDFSR